MIRKSLADLRDQVRNLNEVPKQFREFLDARNLRFMEFYAYDMVVLVKRIKVTLFRIRSKHDRENEPHINKDATVDACSICLEDLPRRCMGRTVCKHYFCRECILEYFKQQRINTVPCPLCRFEIERPISQSLNSKITDAPAKKAWEKISSVMSSARKHAQQAYPGLPKYMRGPI